MRRSTLAGLAGLAVLVTTTPAFAGQCRDPWVTQAVTQVQGRAPIGSGDSGECNTKLYGGGSWTTYADLLGKVTAAYPKKRANVASTLPGFAPNASLIQQLPSRGLPQPSGLVSDNGGGLVPKGQPR